MINCNLILVFPISYWFFRYLFMHKICYILLLTFVVFTLQAQEEGQLSQFDTIPIQGNLIDSLPVLQDSLATPNEDLGKRKFRLKLKGMFKGPYPIPKKALLLSFAVPGLGQIYNKKYWKLPIVYGAIGGLGYAAFFNRSEYIRFRTAHRYRVDGDPTTVDEFTINGIERTDAENLRNIRDGYAKDMQLSYAGLIIVYALGAVDAFVDAHLYHFNVDEDLSMSIIPNVQLSPEQVSPTLTFSFQLRNKKTTRLYF